MNIIAYTYEADYHCPDCTRKAYALGQLLTGDTVRGYDEHTLPFDTTDAEGNRVHPVFSLDELPCDLSVEAGGYTPVSCGDCRAIIKEASPERVLTNLRVAADAAARGAQGTGPVNEAALAAIRKIIAAALVGTVTWVSVPGTNEHCPALQGNGGGTGGDRFQLLIVRYASAEEGGKLCDRGTVITGPGLMFIHLHPAIAEYLFTVGQSTRN